MTYVDFNVLLGKTLKKAMQAGSELIIFQTTDDTTYHLTHHQDCCESVYIESIVGNLKDLVGSPITLAEEISGNSTSEDSITLFSLMDNRPLSEHDESWTWTFYKLATVKGYVDIRWYGTSNGYYSERVDFVQITKE